MNPDHCLTDPDLRRLLSRDDSAPVEPSTEDHLGRCTQCRERLESLAGGSAWLAGPPSDDALAADHPPAAADGSDPLPSVPGYRIESRIGGGGMGLVYSAIDEKLGRKVAVKLLAPHLAASATSRERFLREARTAAAIQHPNVITIHAVEEPTADAPFLVMEFVEGGTLADDLRARRLEPAETLTIARDLADALAATHAAGVVHRDLKPANILREAGSGKVKLTDFGLARTSEDTLLTLPGMLPGTPHYMAPEQANGQPADTRSDLFALGAVLYEMATGQRAFEGESPLSILRRICDSEPAPIEELAPNMPAGFHSLVRKLLAKNRADRPATAGEVASRLREMTSIPHREPGGRANAADRTGDPPRSSWRALVASANPATAVGLSLLVAVAAIALQRRISTPDRQESGDLPAAAEAAVVSESETVPAPIASSPPADREGPRHLRVIPSSSDGAIDAVDRSLNGYASLAEAVSEARPGDVIELHWDGRLESEPLVIPSRSITIEAAPERSPGLLFRERGGEMLRLEGDATLRGIELVWIVEGSSSIGGAADAAPPGAHPPRDRVRGAGRRPPSTVVTSVRGSFTLDHCRIILQLPDGISISGNAADWCAIEGRLNTSLEVRHSSIFAPGAAGIACLTNHFGTAPSTMVVDESLIVAASALVLGHQNAFDSSVVLRDSTLVGETGIQMAVMRSGSSLTIAPEQTAIHAGKAIAVTSGIVAQPDGMSRVRWAPSGVVSIVDDAIPLADGSVSTIEDGWSLWRRHWGEPGANTRFAGLTLAAPDWPELRGQVLDWRAPMFAVRSASGGAAVGADPSTIGPEALVAGRD